MNKTRTDFAKNLIKLRKKAKLTQNEIAQYIGVTRSVYAKFEADISPEADKLVKIAEVLGVSMSRLMATHSTDYGTIQAAQKEKMHGMLTLASGEDREWMTDEVKKRARAKQMVEAYRKGSSSTHKGSASTDDEQMLLEFFRKLNPNEQKDFLNDIYNKNKVNK